MRVHEHDRVPFRRRDKSGFPSGHYDTLWRLILRWLFDVVDDEGLDGAAGGFELEAELLLNCGEDVGSRIWRRGGAFGGWRRRRGQRREVQLEVIAPSQAGAVLHFAAKVQSRQVSRELLRRQDHRNRSEEHTS